MKTRNATPLNEKSTLLLITINTGRKGKYFNPREDESDDNALKSSDDGRNSDLAGAELQQDDIDRVAIVKEQIREELKEEKINKPDDVANSDNSISNTKRNN